MFREARLSEPDPAAPTLLGLRFAAPTRADARARAVRAVDRREPIAISAVNAPKVVRLPRDPVLRDALAAADLLLPDGASLVWAARVLGAPLPERVTGADLLEDLLSEASARGWRVFLLGATEPVSVAAAENVRRRWPGLVLAGRHAGWFDEAEIESTIASAKVDLLVLGLESPRKEALAVRWRGRLGVPVVIGVGGALDVIAGARRRAPAVVQRLGLEWAWRTAGRPVSAWPAALRVNADFARIVAAERRTPGAFVASWTRA